MSRKKTKQIKKTPPVPSSPIATVAGSSLWNNFRVQAFFLGLIVLVIYSNTFQNGYAVDDDWVIVKNEGVSRGIAGIPDIVTSDIYDSYYRQYNTGNQLGGGRYRPLALVTYAIEQQFWGQPFDTTDREAVKENEANSRLLYARHVTNVVLYLLSVIVLLHFLRKIVFREQPLIAFLAILLFTVHPIHTEVVANIKSRDEILSLLFITCTLINAWKFKEKNKPLSLLLALVYFFLALLSKEYAVSLIVLIPLLFYIFKKYTVVRSLQTAVPYLAVLIVYLIMRFSFVPLKSGLEDTEVLNNPYLLATGMQKWATKIAALLYYVKLLVAPHPLSVDYSYNQIPYKNLGDALPWMSLVFHVGVVAALGYFIKKRHALAFAIAIYLANLFLVSNLVFNIGAPLGERLIYHSSLGFCMIVAYMLYQGYKYIQPFPPAAPGFAIMIALLVLLSAIKTIDRNKDWESNSTLYRKDVITAGNSAITNGNAGLSYLNAAPLQQEENARRDMLNRAMHYFNKAIAIHPGYTFAILNRGIAFFEQGQWDRAKQDWDIVKEQFPAHPDLPGLYASYYINTAVSKYGSKGKYEEAITMLKQGAALVPGDIVILFNLGYYYNLAGKKDSAINAFREIITLKPNDTLAIKCASFINLLKKGG